MEILGVRVGDLGSSDLRKELGKARQGNDNNNTTFI